MSVRVHIADGPLPSRGDAEGDGFDGAGAVLVFEGVVRGREGERAVAALDYEIYEPMAQNQIEAIARELIRRHGLFHMLVEHSRGRVAVGEQSQVFRRTEHQER